MLRKLVESVSLAIVIFVPMSHPAAADGLDGTYRGTLVCDKLNITQYIVISKTRTSCRNQRRGEHRVHHLARTIESNPSQLCG